MGNILYIDNMNDSHYDAEAFYNEIDQRLSMHEELEQKHLNLLRQEETVKRFTNWMLHNLLDNPKELIITCLKIIDPSQTYTELKEEFGQDRQTVFRQVKRFVQKNPGFKSLMKQRSLIEEEGQRILDWLKESEKRDFTAYQLRKNLSLRISVDDLIDHLLGTKKIKKAGKLRPNDYIVTKYS